MAVELHRGDWLGLTQHRCGCSPVGLPAIHPIEYGEDELLQDGLCQCRVARRRVDKRVVGNKLPKWAHDLGKVGHRVACVGDCDVLQMMSGQYLLTKPSAPSLGSSSSVMSPATIA